MLASLKLMVVFFLFLVGGLAILIGNKKWSLALRLIFGKEKAKKTKPTTLGFYLYVIGGACILVGLLILF